MKKLCAIGLIALGARVTIYSQETQISSNSESPCEIMRSALLVKSPAKKTISDLPNEIITKIFRYLDTKSKLQCAQASRQFKAIADSERSLVHAIDSESKDYMNQDFNFYRGPQLKRISIKGESFSRVNSSENINLTHLKLCENLEELTLADVNLTEMQNENLFSALPSLPHLEVLNLSGIMVAGRDRLGGVYLTRTQASNLEDFLQKSSKLKTLKIPNIDFGASESIFRQLPSTLQDLDLRGCWVLPQQADGLWKSLIQCSGLTSLVLERGLYYDKNAEDFFKSLPQTLEILKLRWCRFNDHPATALFKRLPLLKNLHTLDLGFAMGLAELRLNAFQRCFPQSLEKVDLSCCNITREQSEILLDTMSTLKKLQEVRLDSNRNINVERLQELNNLPDLQAIVVRNSGLRERPAGITKNIEVYI